MFSFIASLFGYVLNTIYGVVNNYGIAIIIFTVALKTVMLPISIKQQRTMKKTAKIQVKAKEIQEKYSNDQVRQSQELMDLYKKENMSPFSGCLSSIIQLLIVLSVFYLVSSPLTYMKHLDKQVVTDYIKEVNEKYGNDARYKEIAVIKEFSEKDESVRINMNFLGLDLSDVPMQNFKDDIKVLIIPALYVITSIISTKITTSMNNKKEEDTKEDKKDKDDEMAAINDMNKQMMLMMPIMSVMIALIAPLGLALYWLVSNILMIGERVILNKFFKEIEEE